MSFYSDASLTMIPSGIKDQKVYSVTPTDGSGDLTFSRASNATRVNSAGLIEKVRTNQVLQSQTFDNASWVKYNSSVTANSTTAPDGTSTADTLVDNTANDIHVTYQSIALSAGEHTISCYAKANTLSHLSIYIFDGTNFFSSGIFNLSNGTVSGAGSIVSAGNGWYRVSFTTTIGSGSGNVYIALSNGSTISYVGSGQSIYIWGYQVETGVATDYIPTTTAAVSVGPVSGLPRLDYSGGASCPSLLLEPQRTNLATYSEQIDNAAWLLGDVTITANQTTSPDGYVNADMVTSDAVGAAHYFGPALTSFTAGSVYTTSIFVKKGTGRYFQILYGSGAFTLNDYANFDLQEGVVTFEGSAASAKISDYSNGWYRCSITSTCNANFNDSCYGGIITTATASRVEFHSTSLSYYAWGFQTELGAYSTSYINTLSSAVTRVADAASKTGISSLIGQTEGTIYAEVNFDLGSVAQESSRIQLSDGTTSNWIFIGLPDGASSNLLRMYVNAPSGSVSAYSSSPIVNGVNKIAFGYKSGSFVLYVNGVQSATSSTTLTMAACSRIDLQGAVPTEAAKERTNYKQVLLFKTRLSNASLSELTTL